MKAYQSIRVIAAIVCLSASVSASVVVHLAGEGDYTNTGTLPEDPVLFAYPQPNPGTPAFTAGVIGEAMDFTHSSSLVRPDLEDMLEFTSSTGLLFPSSADFTIEMWIQPKVTYASYESIFTIGVTGSDYWRLTLWKNGYHFLFGGQYGSQWAYNLARIDEWQHVALVYDPGLLTFYHNGQRVASRAVSLALAGTLKIAAKDPQAYWNSFHGYIDEFRIHDGSLSEADIYWIYSNQAPVAVTGPDQVVECMGSLTSVELDATASWDPDGDPLQYEWSLPTGSGATVDDAYSPTPIGQFPEGPTLVTLIVTDQLGRLSFDDVLITVVDTTPPALICMTDVIALWPPNNQMVPVNITLSVSDMCAPELLEVSCSVTSSEPDSLRNRDRRTGDTGGEDGYTNPVPVTMLYDGSNYVGTIELRAERNARGRGRVYSFLSTVVDANGNEGTASCVVVVPHNMSPRARNPL